MTHFEKKEESDSTSHENKNHHEHSKHHEHHEPKTEVYHDHKHKSEVHKPHGEKKKKSMKVNLWKVFTGVLAILLLVSLYFNFSGTAFSSEETVATETLGFVNSVLLQGQSAAKLLTIEEKSGLYNMKLSLSGQEIDSYVTKDGEIFFPQGLMTNEEVETSDASAQAGATVDVPKTDKPVVDLFVMSHCPYGTQAEKGILPIVNLLGDKVDFELKFVNYAMHGKKELDEQLNQYCIQKEQNDKFNAYLECFLGAGDGESCLTSTEVDVAKMKSCVDKADKEFKISELFADQTSWQGGKFPQFNTHDQENELYGVQGSPTLIINGVKVSSARSPAAYLDTVCGAFSEQPVECTESTGVSTETYQPGFGYEAGTATAASCG